MNDLPGRATPFYLSVGDGQRFCMYYPPAAPACRGAVLYLAPFGDEMNKSRRMAALQARRLAAAGFAVLQPDLYGCGDSSGELADADWEIWRNDLEACAGWLAQRGHGPLYLWGLRLGGLLGVAAAASGRFALAGLVLWQPVVSGESFLTHLLRLKLASALVSGAGQGETGTAQLRAQLRAGTVLEIGGYEIAPRLAHDLAALDMSALAAPACPVHWISIGNGGAGMPERVATRWRDAGVALQAQAVAAAPFWSTEEIHESPQLLAATITCFEGLA